jgi:hypothetical protein
VNRHWHAPHNRSGPTRPLSWSGLPVFRIIRHRALPLVGLALLALTAAGCASGGVDWELGRYADGHAKAVAADKLTFVYFRTWYRPACTQFEENVLMHPDVLAATRSMVCIPLDFEYDRKLAEQWGIAEVPGYVIVDPRGRVLARGEPPITVEDLLAAMRSAREKAQGTTQAAP